MASGARIKCGRCAFRNEHGRYTLLTTRSDMPRPGRSRTFWLHSSLSRELEMPPPSPDKTLLLIGASRGLGFALAEEYLKRGWHVVATERNSTTSQLHNLLEASHGRLEIDTVDIT